jgi:hypothetical protein
MRGRDSFGRHLISNDGKVVWVDFEREPDPPAPRFPGAGALRTSSAYNERLEIFGPRFAVAA